MRRMAFSTLAAMMLMLVACNPKTATCDDPGAPTLPSDASYTDELDKLLALTNEARAHERPCGNVCFPAADPLTRNAALDTTASKHAEDLATTGELTHETPDGAVNYPPGSKLSDRLRQEGYICGQCGENVAKGQATAEEVVAAWLESDDHCANLMNSSYEDIGLGYQTDSSGTIYWVEDLATHETP